MEISLSLYPMNVLRAFQGWQTILQELSKDGKRHHNSFPKDDKLY